MRSRPFLVFPLIWIGCTGEPAQPALDSQGADRGADVGLGADTRAGALRDARLADALPDDAAEPLCPRLGLRGRCDGQTLQFCAFGQLKERRCDQEFAAMGLSGRCELLSESWGHDCTLDPGQLCQDAQGNSGVCHGQSSGCIQGANGRRTCREDVGVCDPDAALVVRCVEDVLMEFCEVSGQLFGADCQALGGRCDESAGACVDLPLGSSCDGKTRRCSETLSCVGKQCVGS